MAEGEIADTSTIVNSDLTGTSIDVDPRLTECAICLEQLRHPKSLPCLHTFCEECLNVYITKESDTTIVSFPCPVCRVETIPVDQKENKGNWAKQFPTNNFIIEMSKGYDRNPHIHECDPCKKRDVRNVAAKVWWKESNRFLCDTCLGKLQDVHDIIGGDLTCMEVKSGRKFHPMTDSTYTSCPKHKKEMDLFCEDHQSVCCSTCIAVAHRRCDVVITLSEYGGKVRSSSKIEDMRTSLQEVVETIEDLTEDIRKHTEHLGEGRDMVMKQITDLRQKFEERLNKLQLDLTNELTMAYKEEKQNLDGILHKFERMCNGIKTTQLLSKADVIQKDDIQMLSVLQRGTMEIKSCKDLIAHVADTFTIVDLELDHDEEMMNNALILGRLNVTRTRRHIPANHMSRTPLSLAQVKEVGKLCIKTDSDEKRCQATGLVYLSNGYIILTDNGNNKVKMFKESGELVDELSLQGKPWGLCLVDDNTVAVSMRGKQIISIIKITSSKLSHVPDAEIKTGQHCDGITYKDGRYVMSTGLSSEREIYSMTNKNNMIQILHQPNSQPYYLTYDLNTSDVIVSLFSSRVGDTAVYRLSPDGTTTEIAKVGLVRNGNGVDVDREGNLYVCGRESNNVVQISQDGNTVRELVTSSEGLREPFTVSLCDNKFIVSNDANDTSNYVKIYELC